MIDQSTAISWAKDAGFRDNFGYWLAKPEEIRALITRAQNEAYQEAASRSDCRRYMSENFADFAEELRELIKESPR
jgi:hypothetical protein